MALLVCFVHTHAGDLTNNNSLSLHYFVYLFYYLVLFISDIMHQNSPDTGGQPAHLLKPWPGLLSSPRLGLHEVISINAGMASSPSHF